MEIEIVENNSLDLKLRDNLNCHWKDNEYGRKHSVNHVYFDTIDTEEKAYWLGFISADGYIYHKGEKPSGIGIRLAEKDKDHLEKFRNSLGSTHSVTREETFTERAGFTVSYKIRLYSWQLGNALINLGLKRNKGINNNPCLLVPNELLRHYWRGLFDGDGSIGKNGTISLYGTEGIVSGFKNYIVNKLNISNIKVGKCKTIYQVQICGDRRDKVLDLLYRDSTIYLDRKYKLYKSLSLMVFENNFMKSNKERILIDL